jgi:hypothetical protein
MFCQYFHLKIKYKVKRFSEVPTNREIQDSGQLNPFLARNPKSRSPFLGHISAESVLL